MIMTQFKKILALAPHTDDIEFGCGGSISKFIEQGAVVYCAAFSIAEESLPDGFPKNILESEVKSATLKLGIKPENLFVSKYKLRNFSYFRQEILEELVELNRQIQPDLVFIPSLQDIHQDHAVIAAEGLRAFKKTTLLSYEIPWNNNVFTTNCFINIEKRHVLLKVDALKCYESQKHRSYFSEDFVWGLARTRGTQNATEYAEAFEVVRFMVK